MRNKIFELEIEGGKQVGFKFGMLAYGEAARIENCTVDELFARLGLNGGAVDTVTLMNFFMGAAICYARSKKKEIDFNIEDISDWIDYQGFDKTMDIFTQAVQTPETPESKKTEAPTN